jgi:signal transduction histidine kinase
MEEIMQKNSSDNHPPGNDSFVIFKPGPFSLFVISVVTIFVAEAFVMLLIYSLDLHSLFFIGLVDAALLSLFVVPCLYYSLLKPMRETIIKLDNSEAIQNKLEEIDQLKSDLISIASHELCTPVTAIRGYTEILLDDLESERRKEYLEVILSKTNSLERIIDDLGIVDRLETGEKLQVMFEEHDLQETVSLVYDVYRMRFPDMALQLAPPAGPLVLLFDEIRVSQILDNLLSNAVKYSKGLRDVIEVSVIDQGTQALIRVRDNGIGMTEDEVKQVYNKFFRAQTEKTFVGGLGLGMAIVKNIVESHNGTIDIVSQREVGTTVTIALPK